MTMFDYQQRPTTDEYHQSWERIYGRPKAEDSPQPTLGEDSKTDPLPTYSNGCPILSDRSTEL
jgi:hypothetical protein